MTRSVDLIRPRVSLAVAGGSLFGALYYGGPEIGSGIATAVGAGILCAACSSLNQVQEREYDSRMVRTKDRPVAAGRMTVAAALAVSFSLFVGGLSLFFMVGGWPLLLLGLSVPVIYNGLYTPLKPVTPMALLVGASSGAMPPLTGWVGAGGSILDPAILGVTTVFYLWQVPHFWLLHEKHRDDYVLAGFATLDRSLPRSLYRPMFGLWTGAYFIGLACLAFASGPGALSWLVPPATLVLGGFALLSIARNHRQGAAVTVYASLPLTLVILLIRI